MTTIGPVGIYMLRKTVEKGGASALKALVTSRQIMVERKGSEPQMVNNQFSGKSSSEIKAIINVK